jgi:hypothetical protein
MRIIALTSCYYKCTNDLVKNFLKSQFQSLLIQPGGKRLRKWYLEPLGTHSIIRVTIAEQTYIIKIDKGAQ